VSPKVSVCIPAYKQPVFFRRTLESVFEQTFKDYEVIITDDSPDDSIRCLVSEFGEDPRIRYFKNSATLGSPANWNEAINRASGEYVKILHHDDWFVDCDSLAAFVGLLDDNPQADFAFSASIVSSMNKKDRVAAPNMHQLQSIRENPSILFYGNLIGAPSATIYRKKVQLQFDIRLKWLVDLDFYIRLLQGNGIFIFHAVPLVCTTDEAPHQITNECIANSKLQIFEYVCLYNKIFDTGSYGWKQVRFFWKLFRRLRVYSAEGVYGTDSCEPLPPVMLQVLRMRKTLRRFCGCGFTSL